MGAFVENIHFFGEEAIKAGNDLLEFIIVPGWGANLISIREKETNNELLRVPSSLEQYLEVPMLYGTPILFPPNRIDKGRFTFEDRSYQFDINEVDRQNHSHGFVHDKKWELIKAEVNGEIAEVVTEFDSSRFPDVIRQFPHHFILRMSFSLDGKVLHKNAEIINQSNETMPIGIGYHTVFQFPEDSSLFYLQAEKRWVLNDRLLPTGVLEEVPFIQDLKHGVSIEDLELDDVFQATPNAEGWNEAKLSIPSADLEVTYAADGNFKQWVIFNMGGKSGFVCPEPYSWVTNAPNIDLPAFLTGLEGLKPGEAKSLKTSISVSRL